MLKAETTKNNVFREPIFELIGDGFFRAQKARELLFSAVGWQQKPTGEFC